jgi:membrane dipeptidase
MSNADRLPMLLIDGHLDLAMNALWYERDQTLPLADLRARERGPIDDGRGTATVTLPELRRANIALVAASLIARAKPWVTPDRNPARTNADWPSQDMAYAAAQSQLAYYQLLHRRGDLRLIADRASLDAHWASWQRADLTAPVGLILTMEGADPIVDPEQLHAFFAQGLRALSLAHFGHSHYAAGTPSSDPNSPEKDGPLTSKALDLFKHMKQLGIALDLTHLSDTSFFQAVEHFDGPIYSSHTNCRALAPHVRQFTDQQIKIITDRDGVLGMALHYAMIRAQSPNAPKPHDVRLSHLVDHIDHICQLVGSASHVAIGSDLDGGFGREHSPTDLDSCADLHRLGPMLSAKNFSDDDIANFFHGNWLRFFQRILPQ